MRVRLATRKHRIGVARVIAVLEGAHTVVPITTTRGEEAVFYRGLDHRGRELEVIAIHREHDILVVHAMPVAFRSGA